MVIEHSGTQQVPLPAPPGATASLPNPAIEEFNWEDTTRYSAGVRHTLQNDTVLRFGLAKEESTQSSDNRSAISPDSDRIWATIGAGFKPTENLSIDVAYAHIFVDDADIYKDGRAPAVLDGTLRAGRRHHRRAVELPVLSRSATGGPVRFGCRTT